MDEYNVVLSPCAKNDFYSMVEYMNTMSPNTALRSFDSFMEKTALLRKVPDCCPLARDAQLRLRGYRLLKIGKFIIFYTIVGYVVEIRRILYARRQYEQLF